MQIKISWLLQKPTDLDLHCLQRQGISRFSRTRDNYFAPRAYFIGTHWDHLGEAAPINIHKIRIGTVIKPALVPQSYASQTGDREVAGSAPARFGNILLFRWIMKYFLHSFSPFLDSRRAVVSFCWKNVHKYWSTVYRSLSR